MKFILSDKKIKDIPGLLKTYPKVIAGYLFGSFVKGKTHIKSDLDIGLLCFDKKNMSPVEIGAKFEKLLPDYKSDVSLLDINDNPLLLIQIINGKLVYQKSLVERLKLETRILKLYEDYRYFRKIHNYYLDKSFKEGVYAS